jgi:hypothetical protein
MSEKNKSQMGDLMRDEDSETYEKIMSNKWKLKAYSMSRLLDHYLNDYSLN